MTNFDYTSYKRLDQLGMLSNAQKKAFAEIAKEADLLVESGKKKTDAATPKKSELTDKRSVCQRLATSKGMGMLYKLGHIINIMYSHSTTGPAALAWLKAKIEEAALLRGRFELAESSYHYSIMLYLYVYNS